jgi:hypothetical protein
VAKEKRLPEFPTDWHQERYGDDLERELQGALVRGDDDQAANARAELYRIGRLTKPGPKPKAKAEDK